MALAKGLGGGGLAKGGEKGGDWPLRGTLIRVNVGQTLLLYSFCTLTILENIWLGNFFGHHGNEMFCIVKNKIGKKAASYLWVGLVSNISIVNNISTKKESSYLWVECKCSLTVSSSGKLSLGDPGPPQRSQSLGTSSGDPAKI